MAQSTAPQLRLQIVRLRRRLAARPELGLDTILPEATVQRVLAEEGARWRCVFYTPWLTFWAFFWQSLSPDHSCRAAVKRIAAWMGRRGQEIDEEAWIRLAKVRGIPGPLKARLTGFEHAPCHEKLSGTVDCAEGAINPSIVAA